MKISIKRIASLVFILVTYSTFADDSKFYIGGSIGYVDTDLDGTTLNELGVPAIPI